MHLLCAFSSLHIFEIQRRHFFQVKKRRFGGGSQVTGTCAVPFSGGCLPGT